MSNVFLAAAQAVPTPDPQAVVRRIVLESLDGFRSIPLDGSTGWWRLPGSTGLEMPPVDVITASVPGVAGSVLQDVRATERQVGIPMFTASSGSQVDHLEMLDEIRSLVDPLTGMFRIVGTSARAERVLSAIYTGGFEGSDGVSESGTYWRKLGLTATACDPFAYDREPRSVEFQVAASGAPFIGVVGGTDAPWPAALESTTVIGEGMRVRVTSEVPVFPTLELVGPLDSFDGSMSTGWSVSVPDGLAAGETFRLVTDPRARSIRVNGALAAGRVARGSTLRPFYPGVNGLDVTAPGGTEATRVRLSWTEAHRSLW